MWGDIPPCHVFIFEDYHVQQAADTTDKVSDQRFLICQISNLYLCSQGTPQKFYNSTGFPRGIQNPVVPNLKVLFLFLNQYLSFLFFEQTTAPKLRRYCTKNK